MRSILFIALALASLLFGPAIAAAPVGSAVLCGACSATLAVTSASARVALPSTNPALTTVTVWNAGAKDAYFLQGDVSAVATTAATRIPAGASMSVQSTGGYIAAVTAGSDTTSLYIWQANGPVDYRTTGVGGPSPAIKIDSTADGTTNRVVPPYTRTTGLISGSFSPAATSYTVNQIIGAATGTGNGAFTVATGLPAGTRVRINRAQINFFGASFTVGVVPTFAFQGSAFATTLTDGAAPTWNAADNPLFVSAGHIPLGTADTFTAALSAASTVDSNGNIYITVVAGGSVTLPSPVVGKWTVELIY